jgi:hypothetical protein
MSVAYRMVGLRVSAFESGCDCKSVGNRVPPNRLRYFGKQSLWLAQKGFIKSVRTMVLLSCLIPTSTCSIYELRHPRIFTNIPT